MGELSQRKLLTAMGATTGAGLLATPLPAHAASWAPTSAPAALPPVILDRTIDASAFFPPTSLIGRVVDPSTGVGTNGPGALYAALDLQAGTVVREIEVSYMAAAPTTGAFLKRTFGLAEAVVVGIALLPGNFWQHTTVSLTEYADSTASYFIRISTPAGQTVGGVRIGYSPPVQAFTPVTLVRVLDTRLTGGKLGPDEERVIALGLPAMVRGAVINLTVTETEGAGYVAVFPAYANYAGTSSINWSAGGQNIANGVITAVDESGQVKIRGGVNRTHVVIDLQAVLL